VEVGEGVAVADGDKEALGEDEGLTEGVIVGVALELTEGVVLGLTEGVTEGLGVGDTEGEGEGLAGITVTVTDLEATQEWASVTVTV